MNKGLQRRVSRLDGDHRTVHAVIGDMTTEEKKHLLERIRALVPDIAEGVDQHSTHRLEQFLTVEVMASIVHALRADMVAS